MILDEPPADVAGRCVLRERVGRNEGLRSRAHECHARASKPRAREPRADARRHLVHDSTVDARIFDLGPLGKSRDRDVIDGKIKAAAQGPQGRDFESGAAR